LLRIAKTAGFVHEETIRAGDQIKDQRDLIHPHRQLRKRLRVDANLAGVMFNLLGMVLEDLKEAEQSGAIRAYVEYSA
jgi:hypothetical protein